MIASGKSHQTLLDYIQILLKKRFEIFNEKYVKFRMISMIMPTRSSDRICYLMRNTGNNMSANIVNKHLCMVIKKGTQQKH